VVQFAVDGRMAIEPADEITGGQQFIAENVERPALDDVVGNLLARTFAIRHAGAAGFKPNGRHFVGPFRVVVRMTAFFLAAMGLPGMCHFVAQRGKHALWRLCGKVFRVHRNLVSRFTVTIHEAILGEISPAARVSMQGNQAGRQFSLEQALVEELPGVLPFLVNQWGRCLPCLFSHNWIAQSTCQ
jgi:hypothetical protein